jgi:hypothetical protein
MRLLLIVLLFANSTFSQECPSILLIGKVMDTLRPQSFYNLMIVNNTTGKGVFGLPNGQFQLYVSDSDDITFSIRGYTSIRYRVTADENCQSKALFYIEQKPQEIREVVVRPLKTLEQIKEERSALALRETRQVTGIAVLQSPITALYQAFSRKEKNKRIVAQKQYEDKQKAVVQELLRLYVAYEIIELDENSFDDFIAFLNVDEKFLKTASEMELITFIQDKFEHFINLKAGK